MAISVGRLRQRDVVRTRQLERYGVRLAALVAYAGAVALALVLLAPVLFRGDSAPATPPPPFHPAEADTVRRGDTLDLLAARNGISVARLLTLNPELTPFGLEPRTRVRVR